MGSVSQFQPHAGLENHEFNFAQPDAPSMSPFAAWMRSFKAGNPVFGEAESLLSGFWRSRKYVIWFSGEAESMLSGFPAKPKVCYQVFGEAERYLSGFRRAERYLSGFSETIFYNFYNFHN